MKFLRHKRIWVILLLPAGYGLTALAHRFPDMTETIYSARVYPFFRETLGRLFGHLPFSVVELLLYALILGGLCYIVYFVKKLITGPAERRDRLLRLLSSVFCILGAGYFVFVATCGLNYHRYSFARHSGLPVRDSSLEELYGLCLELSGEANRLRAELDVDEAGVMRTALPSFSHITREAQDAYANLAEDYPVLGGYTPKAKPVLLSRGMSYLNISGIYIPFTFEANVNADTVDYLIPSTVCHELAHFKGFMREDEANFISYLACRASEHPDLQYSGVMMALTNSTNALYVSDSDRYWEIVESMDQGVRLDRAANSAYWSRFKGPVAEASVTVNNTYLRSNRQEDGVKSYGRMVDLLLAEYRQRHGIK